MPQGVTKAGPDEWEIPVGYVPGMRVPGRFFLSDSLEAILEPGAIQQLANVATLPGIVRVLAGYAGPPLGIRVSHRRGWSLLS